MKNVIKYCFIAFIISFLCAYTETVEVLGTNEEKAKIQAERNIEKQKELESKYKVIRLDGCQYYIRNLDSSGYMSHKGNCDNPVHDCR